jgi:hypothetical protein
VPRSGVICSTVVVRRAGAVVVAVVVVVEPDDGVPDGDDGGSSPPAATAAAAAAVTPRTLSKLLLGGAREAERPTRGRDGVSTKAEASLDTSLVTADGVITFTLVALRLESGGAEPTAASAASRLSDADFTKRLDEEEVDEFGAD